MTIDDRLFTSTTSFVPAPTQPTQPVVPQSPKPSQNLSTQLNDPRPTSGRQARRVAQRHAGGGDDDAGGDGADDGGDDPADADGDKKDGAEEEKIPRDLRAVPGERDVYSVGAFCARHTISRDTFYDLQHKGLAPETFRIGNRQLVTKEAAARWRRMMERNAKRG